MAARTRPVNAEPPPEPAAPSVRVLERDPELGLRVPPERIALARQGLVARAGWLEPGVWEAPGPAGGLLGYLILDGVIAREIVLAGQTCTELLGDGDVVQPWIPHRADGLVRYRLEWRVLHRAQVAVLDGDFSRALGEWPEVQGALLERAIARTHRMHIHQALLQLSPVETRLLVLLWFLAERWGHVTRAGVTLRLPLSHQMLGRLVGCRRASVTTALGRIDASGRVVRRSDGSWLLRGSPPDELAHFHWQQRGATGGAAAASL